MTDSEFGGSEKQLFTFTRTGAQPLQPVTRDDVALDADLFADFALVADVAPTSQPASVPVAIADTHFDFDLTFNELEVPNHDFNTIVANNEVLNIEISNADFQTSTAPILTFTDDGYHSSGSPSGSDHDHVEETPANNVLGEILDTALLQEGNINVLENDPDWIPDNLFMKTIDPKEDAELYEAILTGTVQKKKGAGKHAVKHRNGQKRIELDALQDEEHIKNVVRLVEGICISIKIF